MNKALSVFFAAAVFFMSGCGSNDPQSLAKQIDELMDKNYAMTDEQSAELSTLIKRGKDSLSQGNMDESMKAFDQALTMLKQIEDTAMFNKSE